MPLELLQPWRSSLIEILTYIKLQHNFNCSWLPRLPYSQTPHNSADFLFHQKPQWPNLAHLAINEQAGLVGAPAVSIGNSREPFNLIGKFRPNPTFVIRKCLRLKVRYSPRSGRSVLHLLSSRKWVSDHNL